MQVLSTVAFIFLMSAPDQQIVEAVLRPTPLDHWASEYSPRFYPNSGTRLTITATVSCNLDHLAEFRILSRAIRKQFHGPDKVIFHAAKQFEVPVRREQDLSKGSHVLEAVNGRVPVHVLEQMALQTSANLYVSGVKLRITAGDMGRVEEFVNQVHRGCGTEKSKPTARPPFRPK